MFGQLKRFLLGQKSGGRAALPTVERCPDCGVGDGELHDPFCTKERCPFCKGQLISCSCIRRVLALTEEEERALDEYIDDSIPPLSDVMQRWKDALQKKGRLPFYSFPDDLLRAAYRGDVEVVRRFLDNGLEPNIGNEVGYTSLMAAARGERLELLRFLLARGSRADVADQRGYTALHWAVAQLPGDPTKQAACVRALIDSGADPNAQNNKGITPLMNAAWFACLDATRELLECGADATIEGVDGKTARDNAIERGHKDLAKIIPGGDRSS